jgi:hypothetical protein
MSASSGLSKSITAPTCIPIPNVTGYRSSAKLMRAM